MCSLNSSGIFKCKALIVSYNTCTCMLCHYLVFFGVMKLRTEFCHFFPIVIYQDISWTHYEISHIDSWFILFFLQNLSWHINGMKEHNQNFSLGIQIHVSFIWSILGIFLLLEIWSKLVIFYWNMICFIIIEKSFSVRISFLVTSFWNDICRTNFWDYDIKEVQELSLLTYILWICVAIWRQFVVAPQMCSHNVPFTPPLICWNNHCYVQSSGCIISIVLVEQHLIFFNYISFRIYRNIFTYVQWCWV